MEHLKQSWFIFNFYENPELLAWCSIGNGHPMEHRTHTEEPGVTGAEDTYIGDCELLAVIHVRDCGLSLRYEVVIMDVVGKKAHSCGKVSVGQFCPT